MGCPFPNLHLPLVSWSCGGCHGHPFYPFGCCHDCKSPETITSGLIRSIKAPDMTSFLDSYRAQPRPKWAIGYRLHIWYIYIYIYTTYIQWLFIDFTNKSLLCFPIHPLPSSKPLSHHHRHRYLEDFAHWEENIGDHAKPEELKLDDLTTNLVEVGIVYLLIVARCVDYCCWGLKRYQQYEESGYEGSWGLFIFQLNRLNEEPKSLRVTKDQVI